jgi:SAM-dependent methyltransferase
MSVHSPDHAPRRGVSNAHRHADWPPSSGAAAAQAVPVVGGNGIDLERYLAEIDDPQFVTFCQRQAGIDRLWLDTVKSEIATGIELIRAQDLRGKRILEVGAGTGLLSILLIRHGYDVTALDPSIGGFEPHERVARSVRQWFHAEDVPFLPIGAAALDPSKHGRFDLIFSVNVLEHIPDLEAAFRGMVSVLSADGRMVHLCPNYTVPYEPHFGLPLVPIFPRATALLNPSLRSSGLWRSLNFVTYRRIERCATASNLVIEFAPRMMLRAFERLDDDPIYRERQRGLVTAIFSVLRSLGLLRAIGAIPHQIATPMQFECYRA